VYNSIIVVDSTRVRVSGVIRREERKGERVVVVKGKHTTGGRGNVSEWRCRCREGQLVVPKGVNGKNNPPTCLASVYPLLPLPLLVFFPLMETNRHPSPRFDHDMATIRIITTSFIAMVITILIITIHP